MLGIILKILAILGLLLLAVMILLLILFLLVMIYPVSYRLWWEKKVENMLVKAKASWLLGLLTVCFEYPTPGTVIVKLLGFTVFDSGKPMKETKKAKTAKTDPQSTATKTRSDSQSTAPEAKTDQQSTAEAKDHAPDAPNDVPDPQGDTPSDDSFPGIIDRIRKMIENILNKIRQIRDKIKNIRQLAEYYLKLLKEEDTTQLFSKVLTGSGKIIKTIRPRKIKGQILLGTGSPDTTGYAMAVYGILSPYLGQNLVLTPDFEEKVLEGQLFVKGRIIVGILLFNGLKVALDRRLHSFIKKLKREVI